MQFEKKVQKGFGARRNSKAVTISSDLEANYPTNITFYLESPMDSVSLKEFEEYAVARLTLLRAIERVNLGSHIKYSNNWKGALDVELEKLKLNKFLAVANNGVRGLTDEERNHKTEVLCQCRKYDEISHFILRLAYCRSEELCRWFLAMELDFFRYKFAHLSIREDRETFMKRYELQFDEVDRATLKEFQVPIYNCNPALHLFNLFNVPETNYYKVPFQNALELVRHRRIFLKAGFAYVPYLDLVSIIATMFRRALSRCIAMTKKGVIPRIEQDERLHGILSDFDKRYTGKSYDTKKGKENSICLQDLPTKSVSSFPLCMKELYDVVEKDHHLKHFGRLQLGLFLKGIELPIEEATKFWRINFTKKAGMDGNRFDKQYLYNIRHMYGKEGKRADYTPYSCMKIITSSVGAGDHHGCPFRHSDATPLRSKLVAAKIPDNGIREILDLVKDKHYQIACQKYFEYTHASATVEGGIQHPNQYFEESENLNLGTARKTRTAVPTTKVNVYASGHSQSQSIGPKTTDADLEIYSQEGEAEEDPEVEYEMAMRADAASREQAAADTGAASPNVTSVDCSKIDLACAEQDVNPVSVVEMVDVDGGMIPAAECGTTTETETPMEVELEEEPIN